MLEVIEKLLILQDRDRKIQNVKAELANVAPEREALRGRAAATHAQHEAARQRYMQIEADRKKLELEVDAKKQQIEKYSLQQFQTKKNDEYRALANEIENCKKQIVQLEDQQLELMERAEAAQKEVAAANAKALEIKKQVEQMLADIDSREVNLRKQLEEYEAGYDELAGAVDEGVLNRYQRLRKHKAGNTVVGIEHSVCGGCHMKLPTHVVLSCQAQQELVACPNCGRILYYAQHMDLAVAD